MHRDVNTPHVIHENVTEYNAKVQRALNVHREEKGLAIEGLSEVIERVQSSGAGRLTDSAVKARGGSCGKRSGPASVVSAASSLRECQTAEQGAAAYLQRFPDKTGWELAQEVCPELRGQPAPPSGTPHRHRPARQSNRYQALSDDTDTEDESEVGSDN